MSKVIYAKVDRITDPDGDEHPAMKIVFDDGMDGIVNILSQLDEDCAGHLIQSMVDCGEIVVH